MRFKLDENVPTELATLLNEVGHSAHTVAGEGLKGSKDRLIADVCEREQRVLITFDLDFSDIRAFSPEKYVGIMVLRLVRQDADYVLFVFRDVLPLLAEEPLTGRLWIIEDNRVRIREGA